VRRIDAPPHGPHAVLCTLPLLEHADRFEPLLEGGDAGVVQEEKAEELGTKVQGPGEDGDDAEEKGQPAGYQCNAGLGHGAERCGYGRDTRTAKYCNLRLEQAHRQQKKNKASRAV
jgi:hypothetical protein